MNFELDQARIRARLEGRPLYKVAGRITKSVGLLFEAFLPGASLGARCRIRMKASDQGPSIVEAEVVGFREKRALLMPFLLQAPISSSCLVEVAEDQSAVSVGPELLGRALNALGEPIDGKGEILFDSPRRVSIYRAPTDVLKRRPISEPLDLGVRAINGLLTIGQGQRIGIMAGSGVGKSVLLGMMARSTKADINVIALVGERGREVREFLERDLGEEGLKRSVVVVSTSDQSPLLRMRAAFLATTIAEYFRDEGKQVLLMMDSVTRFAMAQREIGLAMGEPPASKGYTPSVFATLPRLLERSGTGESQGSITGIYTVLVEGDDMDEPIADAARSILDGHIVLTRKLAHQNHFPAIDVLQSTSRVMPLVTSEEDRRLAGRIREWMAIYEQNADLISVGAYVKGSQPKLDQSLKVRERLVEFLRQTVNDQATLEETRARMLSITRLGET